MRDGDKINANFTAFAGTVQDDAINASDPHGTISAGYGGFPHIWTPGASGTFKNRLMAPFRQKWIQNYLEAQKTYDSGWTGAPSQFQNYPPNQMSPISAEYGGYAWYAMYRANNGLRNLNGTGSSSVPPRDTQYRNMPYPSTHFTLDFECTLNFWTEPFNTNVTTGTPAYYSIALVVYDTRIANTSTVWKPDFATDTGYVMLDEARIEATRGNTSEERVSIDMQGNLPGQTWNGNQGSLTGEVNIFVAMLFGTQVDGGTSRRPGFRLYDVQGTTLVTPEITARSS